MLLSTLRASLLANMLSRKGTYACDGTIEAGYGKVWAKQDF